MVCIFVSLCSLLSNPRLGENHFGYSSLNQEQHYFEEKQDALKISVERQFTPFARN